VSAETESDFASGVSGQTSEGVRAGFARAGCGEDVPSRGAGKFSRMFVVDNAVAWELAEVDLLPSSQGGGAIRISLILVMSFYSLIPREKIITHVSFLTTSNLEQEGGRAWDSLVPLFLHFPKRGVSEEALPPKKKIKKYPSRYTFYTVSMARIWTHHPPVGGAFVRAPGCRGMWRCRRDDGANLPVGYLNNCVSLCS
jgi:hypothetical protein